MPRRHGKKTVSCDPTAVLATSLPSREIYVKGLQEAGFVIRIPEDTYWEQNWKNDVLMVYFQTGEHAMAAIYALSGLRIGGKKMTLQKAEPRFQNRSASDADKTYEQGEVPDKDEIQDALVAAYNDSLAEEDSKEGNETSGPSGGQSTI